MDSVEVNVATEERPNASVLASSQDDLSPSQSEAPDAFNFSQLTPSQFGISVQSFTPLSLPNHKDKSRLAQLKARRRSTIGTRGSPETNSLIRFVAQQRSKTPPASQTMQLVTNKPFLPKRASTLRQKMASFQSLMDVEERGVCHVSKQDSDACGSIEKRDYLSDGESLDEGKENHPGLSKPPQSKRRRHSAPLRGWEVQIRESDAPTLDLSLKQQQVATQTAPDEVQEEARALLLSLSESDPETTPPRVDHQPPVPQQVSGFALQNSGAPAVAPPARPSSFFTQLEMKSTDREGCDGTSITRKKRVHFGGPLLPELFDRDLPPSTPLQRGSTPARVSTPGGALRSALKTPQRSVCRAPQIELDLCSPSAFGASPTFAMPHIRRVRERMDEDDAETYGAIAFPSMEDIDCDVMADAASDPPRSPQLVNLNTAFHEDGETLSECSTGPPAQPEAPASVSLQVEAELPPKTQIEYHQPLKSPVPWNRRKRKAGPQLESGSEDPAQSRSRKRKQPDDSAPAKRSTRSAAISASGKITATSKALRRWNKEVNRSLYGPREFASKNPVLSPIKESLVLAGPSPAAPPLPPSRATAVLNQTPHLNRSEADRPINSEPVTGLGAAEDLLNNITQDALEAPTEPSAVTPTQSIGSTARRRRRRDSSSARKEVTQRGRKGRKQGEEPQVQPETEEQVDKNCQNQTAQLKELKQNSPPDDGAFAFSKFASPTPANAPGICMKAPTSVDPSPGGDATSLPVEQEMESAHINSQSGLEGSSIMGLSRVEEHQNSRDAKEEMSSQQESSSSVCSDVQEELKEGSGTLAPWQAHFNFEDVFKPVATRGQRSVRRSLRNQNSVEQRGGTSGLAWLPWTSPESSIGGRRRTRGRPAPLEDETPQLQLQ